MVPKNDKNDYLGGIKGVFVDMKVEEWSTFINYHTEANFIRAKILSIVVLAVTGVFLIVDISFTSFGEYFYYDVFALAFSSVFVLLTYFLRSSYLSKSPSFQKIYLILLQFSLIWSAFVSLTEVHLGSGGFETFIIVSISIASLFTLNSKNFFLVFSPSIIILLIAAEYWFGIPISSIFTKHLGLITLFPILWFVSGMIYSSKSKEFDSKKEKLQTQFLLQKEIQDRKNSEESLKKLTGKLEELVEKRTRNLEVINAELQKEIAERKEVEIENLESKEKLESNNRELLNVNDELDMFVYRTSHDLRAPLTSLLGLINISKNEKNLESLLYYLDLMQKSVHKLDSYINDILDYSQNTRQRVRKNEINFYALLEEIVEDQKFQDPYNEVAVNIVADEPLEPFYTDQKRLYVILKNLISNAYRFRRPNAIDQKIEIKLKVENGIAYIEILDNGHGIEESKQGKIFEMFYRGSENSKGSGLGLYIVKKAVHKIKGSISVNSEIGKWTLFKLEIKSQKKVPKHEVASV